MRQFSKLNETLVEYNDNWYRMRLRSLQAVDELVEAIYKKVEAAGQLDNTYIMYTGEFAFSSTQGWLNFERLSRQRLLYQPA